MSVEKYAPVILNNLEFSGIDAYLISHEVISVEEFDGYQKLKLSVSNSELVRKLFPQIKKKPRDFYCALREYVETCQDVHSGTQKVFQELPTDFGKTNWGKFKSSVSKSIPVPQQKRKPFVSIPEDPQLPSDTDEDDGNHSLNGSSNVKMTPSVQSLDRDVLQRQHLVSSKTYSLGKIERSISTQSLNRNLKRQRWQKRSEDALEEFVQLHKEKRDIASKMQAQEHELKEKIQELERVKEESSKEIKHLVDDKEKLESEIKTCQDKNQKLETVIKVLTEEKEKSTQLIEQLQDKITKCHVEKLESDKSSAIDALEKDNEQKATQIHVLQEQCSTLIAEKANMKSEMLDKNKEFMKECNILNQTIVSLLSKRKDKVV